MKNRMSECFSGVHSASCFACVLCVTARMKKKLMPVRQSYLLTQDLEWKDAHGGKRGG